MKDTNGKGRRCSRRPLRVHDQKETWSAAGTPGIIAEADAAARLFMGKREFVCFAEQHRLAAMKDGTGQTFRSIAELETLAQELGLRYQPELPWRETG